MTVSEHTKSVEAAKALIAQTHNDIQKAKDRLAELEGQMPRLLLAETLGQVTAGEVDTVRDEMAALKRYIAESPWRLEALAEFEAEAMAEQEVARKAENQIRNQQIYAELRDRFQALSEAGKADRRLEGDLLQMAATVGKQDENRIFMREMNIIRERTQRKGW